MFGHSYGFWVGITGVTGSCVTVIVVVGSTGLIGSSVIVTVTVVVGSTGLIGGSSHISGNPLSNFVFIASPDLQIYLFELIQFELIFMLVEVTSLAVPENSKKYLSFELLSSFLM